MPKTNAATSPTRFAIIDLETTGLHSGLDKIIEVGIVILEDGKFVDTYQSLVDPEVDIPPYIQQYTGITNNMVEDQPLIDEVIPEVVKFIDGCCLVAHNASFDSKFLNVEFQKQYNQSYNFLCTVLLSRRVFCKLASHSLPSLVEALDLPRGTSHRALSDAEMTAHLLSSIQNELRKYHNFTFSADNLARLQRIAPIDIRNKGIERAIGLLSTRYQRVTYEQHI